MAYYLHRIKYMPDIALPLLKAGYLSIGYSHFIEVAVNKHIDLVALIQNIYNHGSYNWSNPDYRTFCEIYDEAVTWDDPYKAHFNNVLNFFSFQPKDIILVPLDGGIFGIYQVDALPITNHTIDQKLAAAGNALDLTIKEDGFWAKQHDGTEYLVDLGGFVRAHPISKLAARISRSTVSPDLRTRLAYRRTNISCNDFANEIASLVKKYTSAKSAP